MIDQISFSDVQELTHDIWSTMAGTELTPAANDAAIDKSNGYIVASVQIIGAMQHVVRLDLDTNLVREAAASLLGLSADELTMEDIRDAAGELANMTGGSLKALLPAPSSLTIPSVVIGTDYEFTVPHGDRIVEYGFVSSSGNMKLCIMERRP
ncbi:MAG: chemotaxis protein CheX [Acidobacteriota bacterium]